MNITLRPSTTIVGGKSGSGKTTFSLRYLVNAPVTLRAIFCPDSQAADRLGLAMAETPEELAAAADDGWALFDPHQMFPGDVAAGFRWFCSWTFWAATQRAGRKVLLVDEVWRYCDPRRIPDELALVIQTGRVHGLEQVFCTQRPNRLNEAITNEATEAVWFRLQGRNALEVVKNLDGDPDEVSSLPPGCFVSYDLERGGTLRGRVF